MKRNQELRDYAKQNKVYIYELAEAAGYAWDTCFQKALQHEFDEEKKQKYMRLIDKIAEEKRTAAASTK